MRVNSVKNFNYGKNNLSFSGAVMLDHATGKKVYMINEDYSVCSYYRTNDDDVRDTIIPAKMYKNMSVSYGDPRAVFDAGEAYIDEYGNPIVLNKISDEKDIETILKSTKSVAISLNYGIISENAIHNHLIKQGKFAQAMNLYKEIRNIDNQNTQYNSSFESGKLKILPQELIKRGRFTEAFEMINRNHYSNDKTQFYKSYGLDENGEYTFIITPPKKFNPDKYDRQLDKLSQRYDERIDNAEQIVEKKMSLSEDRTTRVLKDVATLGIHEIVRKAKKDKEISSFIKFTEEARRQDIHAIHRAKNQQNNKYIQSLNQNQIANARCRQIKEFKSNINEKVDKTVSYKLLRSRLGIEENLPDTVIFTGENPYFTKEFAKISANTSESNFVQINSSLSNESMINSLTNAINTAKYSYDADKKHTVIFVEGMEKLLSEDESTPENINKVMNIFAGTGNNSHATIFFHSQHPDKLSKLFDSDNINSTEVSVPITFEEANIYRK